MREVENQLNYTYILTCADGTLYCGWTNRLELRVKAHNEGRGAKYTKGRRPVVLSYCEAFATKQEAMKRESAIKRLSRREKLRLIEGGAESGSSRREGEKKDKKQISPSRQQHGGR